MDSDSSDSDSSDSDSSMYGGTVYGSEEEEEDEEEQEEEEEEEDFQLGGGENSSADMMDLLVQKRIALRSVVFLHSYEKKYKSYIKKQGDDKGKTYLNTLNIANIYLFKFGFCINANNIHV